jgi:hypothetical protein
VVGLKKFLLIVCVILFAYLTNPVRTFASGEQSVLGLIGKDGDCLAENKICQEVPLSVEGNSVIYKNLALYKIRGGNTNNYHTDVVVFERNEKGIWCDKQHLTVDNSWNIEYGKSLGLYEDIAIVGAPCIDNYKGAVYVYQQDQNGVWQEKQKLMASTRCEDAFFGTALAINKDFIVVGAMGDNNEFGMIYIFKRNGSGEWQECQKLTVNDKTINGLGSMIALSGKYLVAGDYVGEIYNLETDETEYPEAPSCAFVFERNGSGIWEQKQKIEIKNGNETVYLNDLNISDETIIAGKKAFKQDNNGVWQEYNNFVETVWNISGNLLLSHMTISSKKHGLNIFKQNQDGIWQLSQKIKAYDHFDEFSFGRAVIFDNNLLLERRYNYNNDSRQQKVSMYFYRLLNDSEDYLTSFNIPQDRKYLVFKISKNSITTNKSIIKDKIQLEAVGLKCKTDNPNIYSIEEEIYRLNMNKAEYLEAFHYIYYIVDVAELITNYIDVCKTKFKLVEFGDGYSIYKQVGLRVRYDSPVNVSTLKDVYVTDEIDIDSPEAITLNIENSQGGATITWSPYDSDIIQGYQVVVSTSSTEPTEAVDLAKLYTTPVAAYKNLSAKNKYYLWIRGVDTTGNAGPWINKLFSPKPAPASFVNEKSTSTASRVGNQPKYSIQLKVIDVDAANYVVYRENSDGSEKIVLDPVDYKSLSTADFFCDGGSGLVKHETYTYSVYTTNALGEASTKSNNIVMKVANFSPKQCIVTTGWRATEVNTKLSLQLGPVTDLEGDNWAYRVYVRTPGVDNEICVATLEPTIENETMAVDYTFTDKANYEWQVRCIEKGIADATEVGNVAWKKMYIDTDAILVIAKNDFGVNSWGTKKQPLSFTIEKNAAKTYFDYLWYFNDDGTTAQGETVTHTYYNLANETPYQVAVTAVDASGVSHQGSGEIYIVNTPKGKLYDDEEWSGTPGIGGLVIVPEGLTLTIDAGTKVQVNDAAGGFQVSGALRAVDAARAITMDLQNDSDLWQGVKFQDAGRGILTGVTISHASQGVSAEGSGTIALDNVTLSENIYGLYYSGGTVTANQCKFKYNTKAGIKFEGIVDSADLTLLNCSFTGNTQDGQDERGKITASDFNEIGSNSGNESVEE